MPHWASVALAVLSLVAGACGDAFGPSAAGKLEVRFAAVTLAVGDTLTVGAGLVVSVGEADSARPVRWQSSDPSVLSVIGPDLIRANAPGRVVLRARYLEKSDTTTVSVHAPADTAGAQFASIHAGEFSTCGLDGSGFLACWGDNAWGELGRAKSFYTRTVSPVSAGTQRFKLVDVGEMDVCALDFGGVAWCWGDGDMGQLGIGASRPELWVSTPQKVHYSQKFIAVAAGGEMSCGLNDEHQVLCWGFNYTTTPELVGADRRFEQLSVGGIHACGIDEAGAVYCWGDNSFEQLGNDTIGFSREPVAVALPAPARSLSAGWLHTCAVLSTGAAYCWGDDRDGALGDGAYGWLSPPVRVALANPVLQITAGGRHTCAITEGGTAYCWGLNSMGQLGIDFAYGVEPGPYGSPSPVAVSTDLKFTSISAGSEHTCALSGTHAYCWGSNFEGQLGIGAMRPYPGTEVSVAVVPKRVVAPVL